MASTAGGSATVTGCPSSYFRRKASTLSFTTMTIGKVVTVHKSISCSAVQESSTPAVAIETKDKEPSVAKTAAADPAKPKPKPKAPVKPLAELIEEEVIPSLKSTLESQNDIFDLELSFADNKLEGSFVKKGNPYTFWAFFPDGVLTGPKGFSLSSYGMEASTVEPFLVDEKKITAKLVVFWVEKRLAAQGIIPVWRNE